MTKRNDARVDLTSAQLAYIYKTGGEIIERFTRDNRLLNDRAHAAMSDGYPAGGDGARSNDVSDPTAAAVLARDRARRKDRALDAIDKAVRAIDMLITADQSRASALPPDDATPSAGEDCCALCIRVGSNNPTDTSPHYAQPNRYCGWCSGWRRKHKFDPPDWILEKRKDGRRITSADEAKALLEHRQAKRKKKRR